MQIAFKSVPYIQIQLPHLSYDVIYMLPSGMMTTFHHNQPFFHDINHPSVPNFSTAAAALSQIFVQLIYI